MERVKGGLGSVQFPILADSSHKIARDYGVLLEDRGVSLRWTLLYSNLPIFQSVVIPLFCHVFILPFLYSVMHSFCLPFLDHRRGTFIIDTKGIIRSIIINDIEVYVLSRATVALLGRPMLECIYNPSSYCTRRCRIPQLHRMGSGRVYTTTLQYYCHNILLL